MKYDEQSVFYTILIPPPMSLSYVALMVGVVCPATMVFIAPNLTWAGITFNQISRYYDKIRTLKSKKLAAKFHSMNKKKKWSNPSSSLFEVSQTDLDDFYFIYLFFNGKKKISVRVTKYPVLK